MRRRKFTLQVRGPSPSSEAFRRKLRSISSIASTRSAPKNGSEMEGQIRPVRERKLYVQHFHAGIVGSDHFRLEQNVLERSI